MSFFRFTKNQTIKILAEKQCFIHRWDNIETELNIKIKKCSKCGSYSLTLEKSKDIDIVEYIYLIDCIKEVGKPNRDEFFIEKEVDIQRYQI